MGAPQAAHAGYGAQLPSQVFSQGHASQPLEPPQQLAYAGAGFSMPQQRRPGTWGAPQRNLVAPPLAHRGSVGSDPVLAHEEYMPPSDFKAMPLNKNAFLVMGLVLLALLCMFPVWDSIDLLTDLNYAFWCPRHLPLTIILVSCLILVVFFFTTEAFFSRWRNEIHTPQSLVVMSSLFVMLLGLVLVLVSLPLSEKALDRHNDIIYRCSNSESTRDLVRYYQDLLKLRAAPACAAEFSVEACQGYMARQPYADYLKGMELKFRCSGFCYEDPKPNHTLVMAKAPAPGPLGEAQGARTIALLATGRPGHEGPRAGEEGPGSWRSGRPARPLSALQAQGQRSPPSGAGSLSSSPPTLFSQANFRASCDGAASRNLLNFARDSGYQMWYTGILLITLSTLMGVWEWGANSI